MRRRKMVLFMIAFAIMLNSLMINTKAIEVTMEERVAIQAVDITIYNETLSSYDTAVIFIEKLNDIRFKRALYQKLSLVVPKIYTPEMVGILSNMSKVSTEKSTELYDKVVNEIKESKALKDADKTYLLNELTTWADKNL